jgi:NAD(P)-dependent dehydrogenase (short-subunit alcohol dehydrogenase family)
VDVSNLTGRTVLVTGGASGIGRASALAFAERGADLVLCDIDKQGLEAAASQIRALSRGECTTQTVDVADAEQMADLAGAVHERVGAVDILMNNAGVAIGGSFLHTSLEDWDWILGINLRGVILGCHYFVPRMVQRGRGGHVINVASAAGYVANESLAAYSTTKFGVVGLSEALRDELARHQIGVTAVCPGVINTPITRSARLVGPIATQAVRDQMASTYEWRAYGPERVAANILRAVARNRALAPISPEAWLLYYLKRFTPGLLAWLNRVLGARARKRFGIE